MQDPLYVEGLLKRCKERADTLLSQSLPLPPPHSNQPNDVKNSPKDAKYSTKLDQKGSDNVRMSSDVRTDVPKLDAVYPLGSVNVYENEVIEMLELILALLTHNHTHQGEGYFSDQSAGISDSTSTIDSSFRESDTAFDTTNTKNSISINTSTSTHTDTSTNTHANTHISTNNNTRRGRSLDPTNVLVYGDVVDVLHKVIRRSSYATGTCVCVCKLV